MDRTEPITEFVGVQFTGRPTLASRRRPLALSQWSEWWQTDASRRHWSGGACRGEPVIADVAHHPRHARDHHPGGVATWQLAGPLHSAILFFYGNKRLKGRTCFARLYGRCWLTFPELGPGWGRGFTWIKFWPIFIVIYCFKSMHFISRFRLIMVNFLSNFFKEISKVEVNELYQVG